jgi:[acyl-carrier-protein] S-malonyltransferase
MINTAFMFPGQGSQAVGMGKELAEKSEFARKTFRRADEILGFRLSKICFEGPEDELKMTRNTQPALLTVSYILFHLLGKDPDWGAGHSLGEYSAFLCAGSIRFEDALLLVYRRGCYMQEAVPAGLGAMAALLGADMDEVRRVIEAVNGEVRTDSPDPGEVRRVVGIANWNSASQVVISGEKRTVESAVARIVSGRSVFLPVSAPFHSELMLPAEERLKADLDRVEFRDPRFPVINNVEAKEITTGSGAREGLKMQVSRPVLWHEIMEKLLREKRVTRFVEIGTGKVLAGLLRKTAKEVQINIGIVNIETLADIEKAMTAGT